MYMMLHGVIVDMTMNLALAAKGSASPATGVYDTKKKVPTRPAINPMPIAVSALGVVSI